jgi:hypothetical protein
VIICEVGVGVCEYERGAGQFAKNVRIAIS